MVSRAIQQFLKIYQNLLQIISYDLRIPLSLLFWTMLFLIYTDWCSRIGGQKGQTNLTHILQLWNFSQLYLT